MNTKILGASCAAAFALALALGAARPATPFAAAPDVGVPLSIARIYWEYNASANDLGAHVFLDGEDWKRMTIEDPHERLLFEVRGRGPYAQLGMTELFFEGAEPSLDDVPLAELLADFPEGEYEFSGRTVDGQEIEGVAVLSHAIPAGPVVRAETGPNDLLRIRWQPVTSPPPGFPPRPVDVVGYQVIVGKFQVTVPGTATQVTISPELVASLPAGENAFEVLAIDASGNQTITEGVFVR